MRIAMIGGTVFIGRAIIKELAGAGHDLMLIHRGNHEPDDLPEAEHVHVNRNELNTVKDQIAAFRPDVLIDGIPISRAQAEMVCETVDPDVRLVVISSMDAYKAYGSLHADKNTEPMPIDETSPVRDERYPYRGQVEHLHDYDKIDVEEVYATRDATALRLPMVYGPHDYQRREEFVLRRVRAGRKQIPVGSGQWLGTRGFVDDVARGVRLACENDAARGELFNLGEHGTYPAGRWAQMILEAAGSDAELVRVADDKLPEDLGLTGAVSQHLCVDSSKARRMLGWETTPHSEALKQSVTWHLANPPEGASDDFTADDEALATAV